MELTLIVTLVTIFILVVGGVFCLINRPEYRLPVGVVLIAWGFALLVLTLAGAGR